MGIRGTTVIGVDVQFGYISTTNNFNGIVSPVWFYYSETKQLIAVLQNEFLQIALSANGLAFVTEKTPEQLEFDSQLTKLVLEMAELLQVPQADDETDKQPLSAHPSFEDGQPGPIEINGPNLPLLPLTDFITLLVLFVDPDDEGFQSLLQSESNPLSAGLIGLAGLEEMDIGGEGGASESSVLPFNFGPAGPGIVDFSTLDNMPVLDSDGIPVTSMGMTITYVWDAGTNILTAVTEDGTPVFTVTVNPFTGAFTFILLKAIDHIGIGNDDDLVVELTFAVTDDLGAIVQGKLLVALGDDVPTASVTSVVVDEDGLPTGNKDSAAGDAAATMASASGTFDVDFGADGPDAAAGIQLTDTGTGVMINGVTYTFNLTTTVTTNDTLTVNDGTNDVLRVTITDADTGAYSVTLLERIEHDNLDGTPGNEDDVTFTFEYKATDGDNDTATGTFQVLFDDDIPVDFTPKDAFVIEVKSGVGRLARLPRALAGEFAAADIVGEKATVTIRGRRGALLLERENGRWYFARMK